MVFVVSGCRGRLGVVDVYAGAGAGEAGRASAPHWLFVWGSQWPLFSCTHGDSQALECSPPPPSPAHSLLLFLSLSLPLTLSFSFSLSFSLPLSLSPSLCHPQTRNTKLRPPPPSWAFCVLASSSDSLAGFWKCVHLCETNLPPSAFFVCVCVQMQCK